MSKQVIYPKDWMEIHPYTLIQPSDAYFVGLANKLYAVCALDELPLLFRKKMCLYIAAYLEDVISGLGCWKGFVREHTRLYGKPLPFYPVSSDYQSDEVNEEDICFLIWNTWEKALYKHAYINPEDERIKSKPQHFIVYWRRPMKKLLKTRCWKDILTLLPMKKRLGVNWLGYLGILI